MANPQQIYDTMKLPATMAVAVILGFLFLEERMNNKATSALLESESFTLNMFIAGHTSTIEKFNIREDIEGDLSPADKRRRAELISLREGFLERTAQIQEQLMQLK